MADGGEGREAGYAIYPTEQPPFEGTGMAGG